VGKLLAINGPETIASTVLFPSTKDQGAIDLLELSGLAGFLRQLAVGPFAFDQNAHDAAPEMICARPHD
jgi:hypothetical protein